MRQIAIATIAFGFIGLAFSLLLAFLNRKLRVDEDPKVKKILDILPGLNCGACGFSSCRSYAQEATKNPEKSQTCRPAGDEANQKISELLGQKKGSEKRIKKLIVCACIAEENEKKISSDYQGLKTCQAAQISGGALDCFYGCFGFGDCSRVCPTGAITIKNKKVCIDLKKCFLCGKCIKVCPRNLFKIIPTNERFEKNYYIACQNKDKIKEVRAVCSRGCIECALCQKIEKSPYQIKENLSQINYCEALEEKPFKEGKDRCPTKCIDAVSRQD